MNDNPYSSPVDTERGIYDHFLFWRLVKIAGGFILFIILLDALLLTQGNLRSKISTPTEVLSSQIQHEVWRIQRDLGFTE